MRLLHGYLVRSTMYAVSSKGKYWLLFFASRGCCSSINAPSQKQQGLGPTLLVEVLSLKSPYQCSRRVERDDRVRGCVIRWLLSTGVFIRRGVIGGPHIDSFV